MKYNMWIIRTLKVYNWISYMYMCACIGCYWLVSSWCLVSWFHSQLKYKVLCSKCVLVKWNSRLASIHKWWMYPDSNMEENRFIEKIFMFWLLCCILHQSMGWSIVVKTSEFSLFRDSLLFWIQDVFIDYKYSVSD